MGGGGEIERELTDGIQQESKCEGAATGVDEREREIKKYIYIFKQEWGRRV